MTLQEVPRMLTMKPEIAPKVQIPLSADGATHASLPFGFFQPCFVAQK